MHIRPACRQRSDELPVQVSIAPLRRSLWCKSSLSLRADHCPLPPLPLPCCGTVLRAGRGPHGLSARVGRLAMLEWPLSEIWMASEALSEKVPTMATTAPPRLSLGTRSSLQPIVKSFTQSWVPQIQCHDVVWSERGRRRRVHSAWDGVHSETFTGNLAAARADVSLPCLGGQRVHVCSSQAESRTLPALLFVPVALQQAEGACLLCVDPRTGKPNLWLELLTPQGRCPHL